MGLSVQCVLIAQNTAQVQMRAVLHICCTLCIRVAGRLVFKQGLKLSQSNQHLLRRQTAAQRLLGAVLHILFVVTLLA